MRKWCLLCSDVPLDTQPHASLLACSSHCAWLFREKWKQNDSGNRARWRIFCRRWKEPSEKSWRTDGAWSFIDDFAVLLISVYSLRLVCWCCGTNFFNVFGMVFRREIQHTSTCISPEYLCVALSGTHFVSHFDGWPRYKCQFGFAR